MALATPWSVATRTRPRGRLLMKAAEDAARAREIHEERRAASLGYIAAAPT